MKKWGIVLVFGLLLVCFCSVQAEEMKAESKIVSIGLFKNGLAVVSREVEVNGPGTYMVEDVPKPIHGTYWIESEEVVETRVTQREIEQPLTDDRVFDFQKSLAGRKVTVYFKEPEASEVRGKVIEIGSGDDEMNWSQTYHQTNNNYWYGYNQNTVTPVPPAPRYLVLMAESGDRSLNYLEMSTISRIAVDKENDITFKTRKPVLLFNIPTETVKRKSKIRITYLTRGISWAPSYLINMIGPNELELFQKAVIKNELMDLEDVEVQLISGFPNIPLQLVDSPMSLETNWANFFQQLNTQIRPNQSGGMAAMTQNTIAQTTQPSGNSGIMPDDITGEGTDIHYHSIGSRTMLKGDSLTLQTARAKTEYDRVVEWKIPDTRRSDGRYIDDWEIRQNPDKYESVAWDAVRFKNPLEMPMTTGPAAINENGSFHGQAMSYWTNPGQINMLKITKALSIETRAVESEVESSREVISYGGRNFRKALVKGEINVTNHRKKAVTMIINRHFSGELQEADREPECKLLEEGVYSINKRNELVWELEIKPGESLDLTYKYEVLIYH